jgi:hypothetical protein
MKRDQKVATTILVCAGLVITICSVGRFVYGAGVYLSEALGLCYKAHSLHEEMSRMQR